MASRRSAIARCCEWVDEMGRNNDAFSHVLPLHRISFETIPSTTTGLKNGISSSNDAGDDVQTTMMMVGVFAKQAIKQGDILLTVSQDCVVSESHPLLEELANKVVDKSMAVYRERVVSSKKKNKTTDDKNSNPWDQFHKSDGLVFCEDELRLALHMTLLLYVHKKNKKETGNSALHKAAGHFAHYLDTLPENYDSLIFHWNPEELDNLKGTSCHATAERLRKEAHDNWQVAFQDVLVEYIQKETLGGEIDNVLLYKCYVDGICTVYSRMHALDVVTGATTARNNTRCTCPLVDLINGDREDSIRCNTHLLHYPGTHVALQATRNIVAGEELIFSYGQVSNQTFVTKFGFLPTNKQGNPKIDALDTVYVLPPPHFVWESSDPRWQSLTTTSRDGKSLERNHLLVSSSSSDGGGAGVSAETGTPFALLGDRPGLAKVRVTENERPHFFENFHLFAMMSLTDPEMDPEEQIIEPWEPGAMIMEMIDYRLQDFPTSSMKEDQDLLASQKKGNLKTGTLYRMLERELLQLWRHAAAKQYDVYGEKNSKGVKFQPLAGKEGCAVCQAVLAGPLKSCTQCKTVSYCTRTCQKEDWRGGHRETCRPIPK